MFDLPMQTSVEKREYRYFRKNLIREGFMMMQESVYCKIVLNATVAKSTTEKVRSFKPKHGLVQLLTVTEKQFSKMEYIVGESTSDVLTSDSRIVII